MEQPPATGRIPTNRTDSGVYVTAEFLGARSRIFVKDENGLYSDDPKNHRDAKFIPEITARNLLDMEPNDLVTERVPPPFVNGERHCSMTLRVCANIRMTN